MKRRLLPLLLALSLSMVTTQAQAGRPDGAPTTSLGMADAVSASAVGANALFFNPAGMTLVKQYAIEGNYSYSGSFKGNGMTAAAVDSKTNPVLGLGVAYTRMDSTAGDFDRSGNGIRGAIAAGGSSGGFGVHLGVGLNYGKIQIGETDLTSTEEQELLDEGEPLPAVDDVEFTTMDAGLIIQAHPAVRLAVVARNLLDTTSGDRARQPDELPTEVVVGCTLGFQQLELTFDMDMDIETDPDEAIITYKAGTQFLTGGAVVVRGGFSSDGHDQHERVGFGLGYVDAMMAVDLGMRATVDVDDGFDAGISFRYFLP